MDFFQREATMFESTDCWKRVQVFKKKSRDAVWAYGFLCACVSEKGLLLKGSRTNLILGSIV